MVHTVCHRGFLNISADEKSRRLLLKFSYGYRSSQDHSEINVHVNYGCEYIYEKKKTTKISYGYWSCFKGRSMNKSVMHTSR